MKKTIFLCLSLLGSFFYGCDRPPSTDFYEVNGVISIDTYMHSPVHNWENIFYHTSHIMQSVEDTPDSTGRLSYEFYISEPGTYSVWVLSSRFSRSKEENFLELYIEDEEERVEERSKLALPNHGGLEWINRSHNDGSELMISFPEKGLYTLFIESFGKPGYRVGKIHMNRDYNRKPEGMGLPATTNPRTDPVQAKRDQFVAMPPAWTFGVIYGGNMNQEETIREIKKLYNADYPIDGYWVGSRFKDDQKPNNSFTGFINASGSNEDYLDMERLWTFLDSLNLKAGISIGDKILQNENRLISTTDSDNPEAKEYFRQQLQPFFYRGVDFLKLAENSSLSFTKTAFDATQEQSETAASRGFILADVNSIYDPRFKKYPANLSGNSKSNGLLFDDLTLQCDAMGGLKESVEMVANPRLTTYEIPFLVHDMGGCNLFSSSDITDELYIRWVQFSAFNTMMHLFNPAEDGKSMMPHNFSVLAQNQFRSLTRLRNRLFPYLYSYAHRAYATGVKPVTGDGVRTAQYLFGEAFLVAPVYESGGRNRNVYFESGTWYDYWSGRKYEGGQNWLIDAPLTKIPVFVKAGSIIPYRNYSQTILSGSNDTLTVEVYSGSSGTFRLYEDDYETTGYSRAEFATTGFRYFEGENQSVFTIGAIAGRYPDMPIMRNWNIEIKFADEPAQIELNGEVLERGKDWEFTFDSRTLVIGWANSVHEKLDFLIQY